MSKEEADAARVAELMKEQVKLLEKIEKKDRVILNKNKSLLRKDKALFEKDKALLKKDKALFEKEMELHAANQLIALMREEIMELGGKWEDAPRDPVTGDEEGETEDKHGLGEGEGFSSIDDGSEGESDEGGAKEGEGGDEVDEKMTELYWRNQLCMFAIRWHNEIIAEKCCIINGGFTTKVLIKGPHSTPVQLLIFAIFYGFEIIADWLLVYVLVEYFDVPFLNLRVTSDMREPQNRLQLAQISCILVVGTFGFLHAYLATKGMISDVGGNDDVFSNSTLANATLANVTDITMTVP
jgi:hypothetical protein